MPTILDHSRPNITVIGTAAETTVYTKIIPGGTLGTTGLLYLFLLGRKVKNGGGPDGNMRMRAYYGGTLFAVVVPTPVGVDDSTPNSLALHVYLAAAGATGAQHGHAQLSSGFVPGGGGQAGNYGGPAVDSTVDQELKVTWKQDALTEHSYTSDNAVLMLV